MDIGDKYPKKIIEKGEEYLSSVRQCIKIKNFIYGKVEGSRVYDTEVDLDSLEGDCSCPYGTNCKHAVALYLTYKKGKFSDAENFIKSLDKMSHEELKEMILSKLKENPDWIIKHNLRKSVNTRDFMKSFKKNFSSEKVSEAEAILQDLSFEKMTELQDYIYKNYDELSDKLGEEKEEEEYGYDYWDDEGYDDELGDLDDQLREMIVKKALEKNKIEEIIKKEAFTDEIIANADSFVKFKDKISKTFSKEKYLEFLLSLKSQEISEVKKYIDGYSKRIAYDFIKDKPKVIKELAKAIDDKALLFSIAVHEKEFNEIIENFDQFEKATEEDYELVSHLREVIGLFIKNKFKNEEIAKKLLKWHITGKYHEKQLFYLASQVSDFDFIKGIFNKDHIETDFVLLERLAQINKERALQFIRNKKDLLGRHWSEIVPLFNFLKKVYDAKTIKDYVEENQNFFKTSSHLKKHLKEECGIFVSQKMGGLIVEIK